ncbi:hypothetical protein [Desulfosporosinus sp. Sb-LF]|uniref:hypothetical protein n=1 Tax=Desulfosporosinus sp. Sb-LF TaxID=2560027 RepID=UPI001FB08368|nr:hypothetical protein [Desulfosporosinus sp. Sb-LF]
MLLNFVGNGCDLHDCAFQSSAATTVLVVEFVNAGMMNLGQALWSRKLTIRLFLGN